MSEEEQSSIDLDLVSKHIEALSEHFDSVQIFCTRYEPGDGNGTVCVQKGCGNWYARFGQVSEWMAKEDAEFRRPHEE